MSLSSTLDVGLRLYVLDDAERLAVLLNDPDVTAMTASIPYPYALSDAEAFLSNVRNEEGRKVSRAITLDGVLVGGVGLGRRVTGEEELGYWVGKPHWGKGIATRAVALFLKVLKAESITGSLYAQTARDNIASQKVLLANGFTFSGEGECATPARETQMMASNRYLLEAL